MNIARFNIMGVELTGCITEEVGMWLGIPDVPKAPDFPAGRPTPRPPFIDRDGLLGRLTIPRLHVSAMVREGADAHTLSLALGHIPGTALPGQHGNVGVAGHRDSLFRNLRMIQKNDLIRFETFGGEYIYDVEGTEVVNPWHVSVLNPNRYSELTLVTCYPFNYIGSAPDRFILKARQLSSSQIEQPGKAQVPTQIDAVGPAQSSERRPAARELPLDRVAFEVITNHSRRLAPGLSIGLTRTDVPHRSITGWIWLMPDRRTIWLRHHYVREPLIFYDHLDGKRRMLVITSVTKDSIKGYLLLPLDSTVAAARPSTLGGTE
jgi:sortase A